VPATWFSSNSQYAAIQKALNTIQGQLQQILSGETKIMATGTSLDAQIEALRQDVKSETDADQSAITLIQGIPELITAAVAKAQAAGATPAQLQAISDLGKALTSNASQLGAAVVANTSAA
jgi:hypothetical protein